MKTRQATTEELKKFTLFIEENKYSLSMELRTTYENGIAKNFPTLVVSIVDEKEDKETHDQ